MELPKKIRKQFQETGRRGGLKTKEVYGIDHYKNMQKKSLEARKKT